MGYDPQESLENTINTVGTVLGVHAIVPWLVESQKEDPYFRWESWTKNVMFAGIPQQNML